MSDLQPEPLEQIPITPISQDSPFQSRFFYPDHCHKLAVYLHGWSGTWHNGDLFTALAKDLAPLGFGSLLFNLNDYDESGNVLLRPFSQQIDRLKEVIKQGSSRYPDATISLVCHSLGCIAAARWLVEEQPLLDKIIFLAPATRQPAESMRTTLSEQPNAGVGADGQLSFTNNAGTTTTLADGYMEELDLDPLELYHRAVWPRLEQTRIILPEEDMQHFSPSKRKTFDKLDSQLLKGVDHNFIRGRTKLCQTVVRLLG